MTLNRKHYIWAAAIFLICFAWVLFLTQGLPIADPDDWDHVLVAQDISWKELLTKFVTPWSSSHLWTGQVDRINEMTNRRLFLTIMLKSISSTFGLKSFPYYIFSEALFFAGTNTLVFLLLMVLTSSIFFALFGTVFFLFVPAHYPHVLWITDPITMVHCFMLIGLWNYLKVIKNVEQKGSILEFAKPFFWMLLAGYVAIKTKEPGLTFAVTVGVHAFLSAPKWKSEKWKLFLILFAAAVIAFQIIPVNALFERGDSRFPIFRWSHMSRMLFRNYDAGYDNEPVSAFFSLEQLWPVSIARTFGFFPLWTLVIFLGLYLFKRMTSKGVFAHYFGHPLVVISAIWVGFEILLMGLFQADPRYFSGTMIPITILAVRLIYCVSTMYSANWKRWLWIVPFFSVIWATFYNNFSHVVYLRRLIGQRSHRFLNLAKHIYADAFPYSPQDLRSLALFYATTYVPKSDWPRMREVSYYIDMNYDAWNQLKSGTKEEFQKAAEQGFRYYFGFELEKFGTGPEIEKITVIDGVNQNSLFEWVLYQTRKKPVPMYLLKFKAPSV